ncbi:hypothetical protein [Bacillus sp. V59.32b]|uniref:hypothetical protein n=1 Tax=Bacillus sp. V59.32b TaxID=1758642 RepID=UPI0015769AE9|nr:hypothetical protein [Bacillus sp. V59.32b]
MEVFTAFIPILTLLFTLAPLVFAVWFALRFLKIQTEQNAILKKISDKMDTKNNHAS